MVVFTNGCFDILHIGHIKILEECSKLGSKVIVGLNSDESVNRLKGSNRPIIPQSQRKKVLEAIRFVDEVIIFEEDSPYELIKKIKPDILVKGGDYKDKKIRSAELVEKVVIVPSCYQVFSINYGEVISTSKIIRKIKYGYK